MKDALSPKTTNALASWQQCFLQGVQAQSSFLHLTDACHELPEATFNLKKRLAAYDGNYQLGLQAWLKKTYIQVVQLVGEDFFAKLAHDFSDQQPLSNHNLHDYGRYFPNFIAEQNVMEDLPYLADVAQVDWYISQAYYSQNRNTFDVARFSQLDEAEQQHISFILADDLHIMASDFPLYEIWQLNRGEIDSLDMHKTRDSSCVAIYREGYQASLMLVPALEHQFYQAIQAGNSLSELVEIETEFSELLGKWIQLGWIVSFK